MSASSSSHLLGVDGGGGAADVVAVGEALAAWHRARDGLRGRVRQLDRQGQPASTRDAHCEEAAEGQRVGRVGVYVCVGRMAGVRFGGIQVRPEKTHGRS